MTQTVADLLEQAAKCRRLAVRADDEHAAQVLLALAEEYEELAKEKGNSGPTPEGSGGE